MIAFGDPKFWEPDNVVILCKDPCHKVKSASDRRKYRKRDRRLIEQRYLDLASME
jgi:5-methylcytosine-specific restriction endonuclease McrA